MHVSLDSALGRQRRLNSVGESVLQIAPSAAAAYSLRSLTGGDPKVVRVRRASDNHEQDFTASGVSSGALTSFVNAQVTPPLDIQALSATGRDGDFLIAKAAYSLRSLGTRQATLAATGDTVARANGKFVVQVRRSSDDALKSFTATEVTDGTLLSFVGTGGSDNGFVKTWYDQSVTNQAGDTATGNHAVQATAASQPKIVNAGSFLNELDFDGTDDNFELTSVLGMTSAGAIFSVAESGGGNDKLILDNRDGGVDGFRLLRLSNDLEYRWQSATVDTGTNLGTNTKFIAFANHDGSNASAAVNGATATTTSDTSSISVAAKPHIGARSFSTASNFWDGTMNELIIYNSDQTDNRTAIEANIGEAYSIDLPSGVDPGFDQVDGFVETWYDQSGNSKDAIQTTANLQPVIVAAGVFQNGLKFDSDGSSSGPDFRTPISSAQLSNDPAGHAGFALVWVGNVNEVQHADTQNHSVLGNIKGVATFSTGTIGLTVIPKTGTTKFISETGGSTTEIVQDTNALTPGDFGVVFFSFEDAEAGVDPLLSVDGSTTISGLSSLNSSSSNNIGIMTAITGGNSVQYSRSADGICKEVILYTGDQKSKRVALETNIAAEYGITLS